MSKRLCCTCGMKMRAENMADLTKQVQEHISAYHHPDLVDKVSALDIENWCRDDDVFVK